MALVIPPQTRIDGLVETAGDLAVEGRCSGTLSATGTVTVAAGASCRASIRARRARIHGEVIGHVVCRESIAVAGGARVVGDLRAPSVSVDADGDVDGRVDLLPPEPASAPIRRKPVIARGPRPARPVPPPRPERREAANEAARRPPAARPIPAPPRPVARARVRRRGPQATR